MREKDKDGNHYVDLNPGEELLNSSICEQGAVERKNRRRHSSFSHESSASPKKGIPIITISETEETPVVEEHCVNLPLKTCVEGASTCNAPGTATVTHAVVEPQPVTAKPTDSARKPREKRDGGRGKFGRGGKVGTNRSRTSNPHRLPQLRDWAVVCFDPKFNLTGMR